MFIPKVNKTKQTYKTGDFYQYGVPIPKRKPNKAMISEILKKREC